MKSKILTFIAVIAFGFAANAHIVVMGGAVSVTYKRNGTVKIKCGNNPQEHCAIIATGAITNGGTEGVTVVVGGDGETIYGSRYEIVNDEIIIQR